MELALDNGTKLAPNGFMVNWPEFGVPEEEALMRTLRKGSWWRYSADSETEAFEREFAAYHGTDYCLAIANGTVAIEAALLSVGMQPGDEVIVPALTFIATASAVNMAGGTPVFADCDPETYQIDVNDIERKITSRTTGIVLVHYAGYPCDMDAIMTLARRRGLFVIEDCAHAHGSEWRGQKVGSFGNAATFSFQMNKALTAGEGGAILTNDSKVNDQAHAYHTIGRALSGAQYDYRFVGPNYRMTEWQSAILREQLKRFPQQLERRQASMRRLAQWLQDIPGIRPLPADTRITQRGCYYYVLRFDEAVWGVARDTFLRAINAEGLLVTAGYGKPVHQTAVYQNSVYDRYGKAYPREEKAREMMDYRKTACPAAEYVCTSEQMTILCHVLLEEANARLLVDGLTKLWRHRDALKRIEAHAAEDKVPA